jgi:hypothetical protein
MGCSFARYCSRACQASHWRCHKSSCADIANDGWDYRTYKDGHAMYYGPVDQFTFELARHVGKHSSNVNMRPKVDLSVPHKLMNRSDL